MTLRDRRSLLNVVVLLVVATSVTLFIAGKAREAVREISALSAEPVYLGRKSLDLER